MQHQDLLAKRESSMEGDADRTPNRHSRSAASAYLSHLITAPVCGHTLHSSSVLLLSVPLHEITFLGRAFHCTASTTLLLRLRNLHYDMIWYDTTWNSLPNIVTAADSLASSKSRLKTHLFNQTFNSTCSWACLPCYQQLWSYHHMTLYNYKLD